jgi:hypothetical protein
VADQRIRVKGRFVTRTQALSLLQLPEGDYAEDMIKKLLLERMPRKVLQKHYTQNNQTNPE